MSEPGLTLSRLVAAERNATAGIEISKMARKDSNESLRRITQLEAEVAALKQVVEQIRIQFLTAFAKYNTGPTERN